MATLTDNTIRNRLLYVLDLHGVTGEIAQSIWTVLATGDDIRPAYLPESIDVLDHVLPWPTGNGRRVLTTDERKTYNHAIVALGGCDDTLPADATASHARVVFAHIHNMLDLDTVFAQPITSHDDEVCGYESPTGLECLGEPGHASTTKHRHHKARWNNRPHVLVQPVSEPDALRANFSGANA